MQLRDAEELVNRLTSSLFVEERFSKLRYLAYRIRSLSGVVFAPHRDAVLARGVFDGLELCARPAARALVREDLGDPHNRTQPSSVPVLVDERAVAGFNARSAFHLHAALALETLGRILAVCLNSLE